MTNFKLVGRVVHHTARPRFTVTLTPRDDGGFDGFGESIQWIDKPEPDVKALAKLMREAGDFFAKNHLRDWVQDACIARAESLGLTAYAIAKLTGDAVGPDHVKDFLERRKAMGSHKLQHVLRALGLRLETE